MPDNGKYPDWQKAIREAQAIENERLANELADADTLASMYTADLLSAVGLPRGHFADGYVYVGPYEFWLDEEGEALLITRRLNGHWADGAAVKGLKRVAVDVVGQFEWAIPIKQAQADLANAFDEADRLSRKALRQLPLFARLWAWLSTTIIAKATKS